MDGPELGLDVIDSPFTLLLLVAEFGKPGSGRFKIGSGLLQCLVVVQSVFNARKGLGGPRQVKIKLLQVVESLAEIHGMFFLTRMPGDEDTSAI